MKIDPRQLLNLLAIAEFGSFNRAAAARGLSQPALSHSIAQLERRLGFEVLDRTHRGSAVNEYGQILLQGARCLEAQIAHTIEAVQLKRLGVCGTLRIGATPSMMCKFMPDLMVNLLNGSDALQICITEGLDDTLVPALRDGFLDLILGPLVGAELPPDLTELPLFDDDFCIGVASKHELAKRKSLSLSELQDFPWILPCPGSAYRRYVESLFLTAGLQWPANSVQCDTLSLAEFIVNNTNRITVVTRLQAARHNASDMRAIAIKGGGRRTLAVLWRRACHLSPLAAKFVQAAEQLATSYRPSSRKLQQSAEPCAQRQYC
jgi:DNA-binding transcriptional LysR family regulator